MRELNVNEIEYVNGGDSASDKKGAKDGAKAGAKAVPATGLTRLVSKVGAVGAAMSIANFFIGVVEGLEGREIEL